MSPIEEARQQGFTDEEILAYVQQKNPAMTESINTALSTGYSAAEVLAYLTTAGPVTMKKGTKIESADTSVLPKPERGIVPSFGRGLAGSVSGLMTGQAEQVAPQDQGFVESVSEMAGGLIGDIPAMFAGGVAGGAAGTAVLPGLGTALGAGAGSFALPAVIRQAFAEYRDYAKGGGEGTFGEFLERAGRVGAAGAKGAALGALTSQASRLLPVLKRMPQFAKLLNTTVGKAVEQPIAEVATLTAGQAALEGKAPTAEDLGMNIAAVAGFKAAKGLTGINKLLEKYAPQVKKIDPKEIESLELSKREIEREIEKRYTIAKDRREDWISDIGERKTNQLEELIMFLRDREKQLPEGEKLDVADQIADVKKELEYRYLLREIEKNREFNETRGTGQRFHGTRAPINEMQDYVYSPLNFYGQGFYTTDALDIAHGYAGKGKGHIYEVQEANPNIKILDLNTKWKDADPRVRAVFEKYSEFEDFKDDKKLHEIYDDERDLGNSAEATQDTYEQFESGFKDLGYRGLEHVGGLITGKKPHNVKIYFYPKEDIAIKRVNVEDVAKPLPKVERPKFEPAEKVVTPEERKRLETIEKEIKVKQDSKDEFVNVNEVDEAKKRTKEVLDKVKNVGVDLAKRVNKLLPESVQKFNKNLVEDVSKRVQNWTDKKEQAKRETFIGMVEKHSGKKAGEMMRSHYKWREALETPIDKVDGKDVYLSAQDLQDMMFYRQRTHNPYVDGDTPEALEKRIPEKAKKIVDEIVDEHFKTWLQRWNDNPATMKKINPRAGLEDIYLPGVWEETSKGKMTAAMKHADEMLENHPDKTLKQAFKLNGPFANAKVFETYVKGIEEGGLTPRYKNIKDLLRYHDEMMIRLEANNELMAQIRKWQEDNGQKVFVLSNNKEAYEQAKKDGWVPFEDKFMRMRVVGKDKDGKPKWEVSPDRALVDPAFAKAVQGVFTKEFYKPEHPAWKMYDNLGTLMKVLRVSLSPFHVVALAEGGVGGLGTDFFKGVGPLRRFFSDNWWSQASKAFEDVDGLAWRAEMGLNFKRPDPETYKKGQELLNEASAIPSKESNLKKPFRKAAALIQKSHRWIFEEYHPRLKIATFDTYLSRVMERFEKDGKNITPELREKAARDVARIVNNQFGGLNWETISTLNLNDPKTQKWMRRLVGYPDWSVSTVRQAADAFFPGTSGELAREYWIRHLSGWLAATYVMRFLYGGLSNKDDKENTFTWNASKAFKALNTKDPNALIEFPLPDVKLNIAGVEFNPGRDEKGRRLHAGFGKQIKELPRYVTEPVDAVFSKANPMLTAIFKQAFGVTPYKGETFPVRGKQKGGSFLPWDATIAGSPQRALSRAEELASELLPFSFRGLGDKGVATTIATGFGAIPTRKSLSLKASETYIYDALRSKNPRKLKEIIDILKDGGYNEKQIRNRIRLIKKTWIPNNELDLIARDVKKQKDTSVSQ